MSTPDLSVVVTFFNLEHLAEQTIQSLAHVDGRDRMEFLLIDDRSTDDTAAVLERASAKLLPGATVVAREKNCGVSAARNLGLSLATADKISFLDGDDFVARDYYHTLASTMDALEVDFVRTDHVRFSGRSRTLHRLTHRRRNASDSPLNGILPLQFPTSVDYPYPPTGMYHRRLLDAGVLNFREELRTCEDREWNWRVHLAAKSFAVSHTYGYFYRQNVMSSLTKAVDDRQLDFIPAFLSVFESVRAHPRAEEFLPKAVRSLVAMAHHHLENGDHWPPSLRRELIQRTGTALRTVDPETMDVVIASSTVDRRELISHLTEQAEPESETP